MGNMRDIWLFSRGCWEWWKVLCFNIILRGSLALAHQDEFDELRDGLIQRWPALLALEGWRLSPLLSWFFPKPL